MEVDSQDTNAFLKDKPGLDIPVEIKNDLKGTITELKIRVTPIYVTVKVTKDLCTYEKKFETYKTEHVKISTLMKLAGLEKEVLPEFVRQRYIPTALDHLKSIFDNLGPDSVIDQLRVSIASDTLSQSPRGVDDNDYQMDKELFLTTLKYHFHYMKDKKLNVETFNMKYSGQIEDEEEVLTFLRKMTLVGKKRLVFGSNELYKGSDLCLNDVLELRQWGDANHLRIDWPMWTDMWPDSWMHFETSGICVWSLKVALVQEIIKHANRNPGFKDCAIRVREQNWQAAVRPYINSNFNNLTESTYTHPKTQLKVIFDKIMCSFDASEIQRNDVEEVAEPRIFGQGLHLLSIDLNPERAYFKISYDNKAIEDTLTPVSDGRCKLNRKEVTDPGTATQDITRTYQLYDESYIVKLRDLVELTMNDLQDDAVIDEFHVSVSWKEADSSNFDLQRNTFIALMRFILERKKEALDVARGYSKKAFLQVEKFVIEYSGSSEDEDNVMAFLPWMKLIGKAELHFRPNRLDRRNRQLVLPDNERRAGGVVVEHVLSLDQWVEAKMFVMCAPFFSEMSFDRWQHFPQTKIVVQSIKLAYFQELLQYFRTSPTFVCCVIETIAQEQNTDIFDWARQNFQYNDRTEFSDLTGFEVILVENMYIFKAPH